MGLIGGPMVPPLLRLQPKNCNSLIGRSEQVVDSATDVSVDHFGTLVPIRPYHVGTRRWIQR